MPEATMAYLLAFKKLKIMSARRRASAVHGPHSVISMAAFQDKILSVSAHDASDDESLLQMARRIREIVRGDYAADALPDDIQKAMNEMRKRFTCLLQIMPYQQLVKDGHVNQLLDDYLGLLLMADEEYTGICERYIQEREYYFHHARAVQETALRMQHLVTDK